MTEPQKEWLAALRSGEYKQIKRSLFSPDGYCCLGVACKIDPKTEMNNFFNKEFCQADRVYGRLFLKQESLQHLVRMNDSGMTFPEIADAIESKPYQYFRTP